VSFGSIAYQVSNGTGDLEKSFGVMIDFFEALPDQPTFSITVLAVFFKPNQFKLVRENISLK
jgi:hypothetical protein